jgi:chromosome segregation ATPase
MATDSTDRLNQISLELASILEARIQELTSSMRAAEATTRQIVAAEMDIARYRHVQEASLPELEALKTETASAKAKADGLKAEQTRLQSERDQLSKQLKQLEESNESLQKENQLLQNRARMLEESLSQLKKLNEQFSGGVGALTQEVSSLMLGLKR